jgi:hypothetical protein
MAVRWRANGTFFAREKVAEHSLATFSAQHPRPISPRRIMAYMLKMATCQFGHPVTGIIHMKTGNRLIHLR